MKEIVKYFKSQKAGISRVIISENIENLKNIQLNELQSNYIKNQFELKKELIILPDLLSPIFIVITNSTKDLNKKYEKLRRSGVEIQKFCNDNRISELELDNNTNDVEILKSVVEGIALSNYQFLKYFTDSEKKANKLQNLYINYMYKKDDLADRLNVIIDSVYFARDLVNEMPEALNSIILADKAKQLKKKNLTVDIFNKKKIETLKMGGLLAVNRGSLIEPTFTVIKYEPENPVNEKPYILIGKGVTFDTGGLSLKPTPDSMDRMKADMAGAASVVAAMKSISGLELPVRVYALIPATDNRPSGNAYVPGDVVKMFNGTFVEVLNTDAEGRMLLADALSYADKFDPELIIELSTLTGSASNTFGIYAIAAMSNAENKITEVLRQSGDETNERLAELPLWDDYDTLIKSDVADLKNIGGTIAGAITAGKFLEHFTKSPLIHLDIAGCAFIKSGDYYRSKGASGIGVRLLTRFFEKIVNNK